MQFETRMFTKRSILAIAVILYGMISACTQKKSETKVGNKNKLSGVWQAERADSTSFEVKPDTIYYTENGQTTGYPYAVVKDSIKVKFDTYTYTAKLYFRGDTMIMDSPEAGIATYHRLKN
jgi:hypothetical protein